MTIGIGIGLGITIGGKGGGGQSAPIGFASTRLKAPSQAVTIPNSNTALLSRISAGSPPYDVMNPRICIPGFWCSNSGNTPFERLLVNDFTAAYAIEFGGVRTRAKFGGALTTLRGGTGASKGYATDFDWGVWTDKIKNADGSDLVIPANTNILHCLLVGFASAGLLYPGSQYGASAIGDVARGSTNFSSLENLLNGNGTITASGSTPFMPAPMYMVAERVDNGELVILLLGDSRASGVGDFGTGSTDVRNPLGPEERGLDSLTNGRVAYGSAAVPGSGASGNAVSPGMIHRLTPLLVLAQETGRLPFNAVYDEHAVNGTMSVAVVEAQRDYVKSFFAGFDFKYFKGTGYSKMSNSSSDNFRSVATQTPAAGFNYPSQDIATLNNAILANANGKFDFVLDSAKSMTAAYNQNVGDTDYDFNRSRMRVSGRSAVLAVDYTGGSAIITTTPLVVGDLIDVNQNRANNFGPVRAVTDVGDGTFRATAENGGFPSSVTVTAGSTVVPIPTGDGNHGAPWLYKLGGEVIDAAKPAMLAALAA